MESLVAVAEGTFTFGWEALCADALAHWPGSGFTRGDESEAEVSYGQLRLPDADGRVALLVEFLAHDTGLGVEGDDGLAAEFFAWLVSRPGFPTDGSVIITDWISDFFHLRPGLDAAEILAPHNAWLMG